MLPPGETYSAIAGLYRKVALTYIVADERDLIRARFDERFKGLAFPVFIEVIDAAAILDALKNANREHYSAPASPWSK